MPEENDACSVAHGTTPAPRAAASAPAPAGERTLVAVFASAVSGYLLRYATDAGYRGLLVEPDAGRASGARMAGFAVLDAMPEDLDGADVVVTDHHRGDLGVMLRDIGSRTPPEIAISTLAGLLAERNSRPGGFEF